MALTDRCQRPHQDLPNFARRRLHQLIDQAGVARLVALDCGEVDLVRLVDVLKLGVLDIALVLLEFFDDVVQVWFLGILLGDLVCDAYWSVELVVWTWPRRRGVLVLHVDILDVLVAGWRRAL